jgi:nitrile hydratase
MEVAVRELLIDKSILTADDVRRQVEDMDNRTPARGAKVVARAWVDAEFKARLLAEGNPAVEEVGLDRGPYKLVVVENTPDVHTDRLHAVSCYPRWLPACLRTGHKSRSYRSRMVREPRANANLA